MNVFVLNAGRCGSTTFIKACKHINNYSSEHESRCALLGEARFDYPDGHIEADNRLSWLLGRLDRKYGDSAFYVYLKRNDADMAYSFTKRYASGIIKAYRGSGILMGLPEETDPMSVSLDYCDTVDSNIELFLKDKTRKFSINLEHIQQEFPTFWELIGAEGDLISALAEFDVKYNATRVRSEPQHESLLARGAGKLSRLATNLPAYIKNA